MAFEDRTEMANRQRDLDEAQQTVEDYTCGECSGPMKIAFKADGGVEPVCSRDRNHAGYRWKESAVELADREVSLVQIRDSQQTRSPMVRGENIPAVLAELGNKFRLTLSEANVFFAHCARLELDPFLGMLIPLTFNSKKFPGRRTVMPFVTEKGWAALAQKTEPDEFLGPPKLTPLSDEEKPRWGYGVGDVVYEALGRKRSWPEGYDGGQVLAAVTVTEIADAQSGSSVWGSDPHHHCRVRVTRRWYEQNYPDAAMRVSVASAELPPEVAEVIEGEYREIEEGDGQRSMSPPAESRGSGGGDKISQAQIDHILRLANSNFGMTEEDVVRHKLNGNPISSLSKSRASELIDHLKSEDSEGARQAELGSS